MIVVIWIIIVILGLLATGALGSLGMFILRRISAVHGNLAMLKGTLPFEARFHYGVHDESLLTSASKGHLKTVDWLLSEFDELSYNLYIIRRALKRAINAGHTHIAEKLLKKPILL